MGGVGRGIGRAFSDVVGAVSLGTIDPAKGRFNVPFTSAAARTIGKGIANIYTAEQLRPQVNSAFDSKEARVAGTVVGTVGGAAAGGGIGAGLAGGAAGGAAAAGGASGGATGGSVLGVSPATIGAAAGGYGAQAINQTADAQYASKKAIASASDAQNELAKQQKDALKAAEDAKLAVQTKQAEDRRRRASKQAQTVLTGPGGLGANAPSYTKTLQPASARRSVLG